MIVPKPQSGRFVGELPFVRLGEGPRALVIFPALGDAVRDVTAMSWRLAWYYRAFAGDHRVYFISRKRGLPAGYTTRQMAADYAEVFERSIGEMADVMGLSLGGLVAQHFAADFPQYEQQPCSNPSKSPESFSKTSSQENQYLQEFCKHQKAPAMYRAAFARRRAWVRITAAPL